MEYDAPPPRFLIHTDLPPEEAGELVKRLESMMDLVAAYWARPSRGVIEAYVVEDLARWNATYSRSRACQIQGGRRHLPDDQAVAGPTDHRQSVVTPRP